MSRRVHELEEQLAQLEWRKLQNARRISEILGNIKQQQQQQMQQQQTMHDTHAKAASAAGNGGVTERSRRLREIEEDEYSKPLRLPRDTIKRLQAEKAAHRERLRKRQQQHESCVLAGERSVMSSSSASTATQAESLHKLQKIRERITVYTA